MAGEGVEFGAVGVGRVQHVAGELDDRVLQAQAEPQVGHLTSPCKPGGGDLAFDAPVTDDTRDYDAVDLVEQPQAACLARRGRDSAACDPGVAEASGKAA